MIKFENTEVLGFEHAIRGMRGKGYRICKNGKYECYKTIFGKTISIGTKNTEQEAIETVYKQRINRFVEGVYPLKPNDCRVFNNNYVVFPNGKIFNLYGIEITGHVDRCGYREVIINGHMERVHRIVALAFIPKVKDKECVNHINGNKLDNRVENLEWCTHSENTKHAYENGLESKMCGEEHHSHKLTEDDVRYIRSNYIKRDSVFGATALSKKFNVDRTTICDVIKRKTWRNVKHD